MHTINNYSWLAAGADPADLAIPHTGGSRAAPAGLRAPRWAPASPRDAMIMRYEDMTESGEPLLTVLYRARI